MGRLSGKVAFVTGAASGIGAACALRFAQEGAAVAGMDLKKSDGGDWDAAVKLAPASCFETGDVREEERIREVVSRVKERLGRIDVLVNSAGVAGGGLVHMLEQKDWDVVLDVNLKGTYLVSKHVLAVMLAQASGSIVNIASVEGIEGFLGGSSYNASKGGVVLLTKNMAIDYGPSGIRVNAVAPCRVVYVTEEARRFSFAYGTLPGHPEQGEVAFAMDQALASEVHGHQGCRAGGLEGETRAPKTQPIGDLSGQELTVVADRFEEPRRRLRPRPPSRPAAAAS
jgi:NAD(P)-dependent dehydrogenase (short-subunit alcohol dehydrogenase family)